MTDVLSTRQPFEWRGQRYPILTHSVGFAHESAKHKIQFRNGAFIEQTGAEPLTFSYTLALRQDIAKGPYRDLFTTGLPTLLRDFLNQEPGNLVDPIYGEFACVPTSYSSDSDPQRRDGVDVQVEFTRTTETDEDEQIVVPTAQGIATEAGALEAELTKIDWQQEPSPEGMTDPLSAVAGFLGQIDQAGHRVSAAMNDFAFKLEKVENSIDRLEDPQHWHFREAVRRNRLAARDVGDRAARPDRVVYRVLVRTRRTLSSVAMELGLTVQELIRHNPALVRLPFVPAGTEVRAPATERRAAANG